MTVTSLGMELTLAAVWTLLLLPANVSMCRTEMHSFWKGCLTGASIGYILLIVLSMFATHGKL
jgi:hypothetical protein